MTLRRRLLDWGLAALLLVIPALILRSSLKEPEDTSKVDEAILRVSSPLQAAVSWLVDGVGDLWSRYVALIDVEDENRELREANEQLRRDLAAATRRAIDIAVLEEMLDLRGKTDADTVGARVIAASMSAQYRVTRIAIDRGEGEVVAGMAVITSAGLVGSIRTVYGSYADVRLTTATGSKVPVVVMRTGLNGTVIGQGRSDTYECVFEIREDTGVTAPIEEGDRLVTSGGPEHPPGIEVGVVTRVIAKEAGMFPEVHVRPTVDFSRLRGVTILLALPPPPDPVPDEKRKSESAFGVKGS
jgi:rod shape-determining protein MreC